MSNDFFPLPSWPDYMISRLGIVRGKVGALNVDSSGRVSLRDPKTRRPRKVHIGEALADAGLLSDPGQPQAALVEAELSALREERDAARRDLDSLSGRVEEAQRVNRHNRSLAPAVATKEATDGDSNTLPRRAVNAAAVAIRRPGKPGNGYRNAALWSRLHSLERELAQPAEKGRKKARIAQERFTWEAEGEGYLEDFEL